MNMSWLIYDFSHMFIFLLWFCHGLPNGEIVRTYVVYMLKTCQFFYCNWLILYKTHFTCNWIVLGVFNTSRNKVSRSSVEVIKSVQETSWRSAHSLKLDSYHVSRFRSCLMPVCSTPIRQLLNTFYLSWFMNFRILIWFSWDPWLCVWAFFSPNPKHIKWLF